MGRSTAVAASPELPLPRSDDATGNTTKPCNTWHSTHISNAAATRVPQVTRESTVNSCRACRAVSSRGCRPLICHHTTVRVASTQTWHQAGSSPLGCSHTTGTRMCQGYQTGVDHHTCTSLHSMNAVTQRHRHVHSPLRPTCRAVP